jgi:hypothetical protein
MCLILQPAKGNKRIEVGMRCEYSGESAVDIQAADPQRDWAIERNQYSFSSKGRLASIFDPISFRIRSQL